MLKAQLKETVSNFLFYCQGGLRTVIVAADLLESRI